MGACARAIVEAASGLPVEGCDASARRGSSGLRPHTCASQPSCATRRDEVLLVLHWTRGPSGRLGTAESVSLAWPWLLQSRPSQAEVFEGVPRASPQQRYLCSPSPSCPPGYQATFLGIVAWCARTGLAGSSTRKSGLLNMCVSMRTL